ncbi:MAG: DUF1326 domain-containing protein [Pyrinomonadaceae bacterium]
MRKLTVFATLALSVLALGAASQAQQISGDYIETRSADVWTGPCVANGEVNLAGDQAILAWRVKKGDWDGISLDGLSVVGVVKAGATLGDAYTNPFPAKTVLIVDDKATAEQQTALAKFAQAMAGELFKNVVRVEVAPINVEVSHDGGHYSTTLVRAGKIAEIQTRSLNGKDHLCGNEEVFYQPLAKMQHAMPAVAELDEYTGPSLGVSWASYGKASAFVGSFAR